MTSLSAEAAATLAPQLKGSIILPSDPGFDQVRAIWNAMIDRRPAIIVQCATAGDVAAAVRFAVQRQLEIAVRGGGHNIAGHAVCEGGMMIDLSLMQEVRVDATALRAYVEPGVTLGVFDRACQQHGLATPVGVNSTTGIAGLTLGAGFGWLTRKYGMTADNLISAKVVTASGELLTASTQENADLFWALRGGGGNFGVVTEFEFQLHAVGTQVYAGVVVFPLSQAPQVLRRLRAFAESCPEDLMLMAALRKAPPLPFLPESAHGTDVVLVIACHFGAPEDGARLTAPIHRFGDALGSNLGSVPYVEWQTAFDPWGTPGARNYWKTHNFTALHDETIDAITRFAATVPTPDCEIFLPHLYGAANRVPADATAYASRDTKFVLNVHARWFDAADDAKCIAWAREFFAATAGHAAPGAYLNFMTADEELRVSSAFLSNYQRLAEIKRRYDPDNVFHLNQNIKPDKYEKRL